MKILFDNGTPKPIALSLAEHEITYARKIGWHELKNGDLILKAEEAGYELLLTTDKNMRYQQNLAGRKIAIVVLGNPQLPVLRLHISRVVAAVDAASPGSYILVEMPRAVVVGPHFERQLATTHRARFLLDGGQQRSAYAAPAIVAVSVFAFTALHFMHLSELGLTKISHHDR